VQDVPAALRRKGLGFACFMDPSRPAVVDADHAVRINYETYLFADAEAREAFVADVLRYCGLVTDPVSKQRFRPDGDSPTREHAGVLYVFRNDGSRDMFARDPDRFRVPGYTM